MDATKATSRKSSYYDDLGWDKPVLGWVSVIALILLFAGMLIAFPPLSDASDDVSLPDWAKFLGRFHVVALHMPVGVFILAAFMEFVCAVNKKHGNYLVPATTFVLHVAAWGAAIAVIFGLFLSRKGGFGSGLFQAHQMIGIVASVGVILTLVLKLLVDGSGDLRWLYRGLFGVTLAVLSLGAHFGGDLVHGEGYLTKYAPPFVRDLISQTSAVIISKFEPARTKGHEPAPIIPIPPPQKNTTQVKKAGPTVYAALVAPLLEAKCTACHNEEKHKADLRLDSYELILKGGTNGEIIKLGDPLNSKLVTALQLPMDDDDHMPPEEKPQPSKEEIALLSWWIKEGARQDLVVAEAKFPEELKSLVQTMLASSKGGSAGGPPPVMLMLADAVASAVDPAVAKAMKKVNGTGALLASLSADSKELRFTALNVAKDFKDGGLKDLEPIADKIVTLDLAKTAITDAAFTSIVKMKNLRELHLENTAVTDAGAAQLKALANLEYLNLYNTKVTDKTLGELGALAKLKAVYVWQTAVTQSAVDAFKAKHASTQVNTGWAEADNAREVAARPASPQATEASKTAPTEKAPAVSNVAANPSAIVFKDVIAPILAAKCTSCHGTEKSKGKLKLHTFADIMKGGSDGKTTVIVGKPDESLIIKRSKLPVDDDDHMPPKDEKQLTKEEVLLLAWWIEQGASDTLTLALAKKTPQIEDALKAFAIAKPAASGPAVAKTPAKPKPKPLTDSEKKAVAEVTVKMASLNASLMPLALDTEQLRFGCVNAADKFGDKEFAELEPVAAQVLWVDLARSKVTDSGLSILSKMEKLERLHLENTAVTDAVLVHLAGLKNLEYLNLYGTKVTDAGIAKLAGNKALKKLFVWQTAVTKDGAKKLEAAIPGLVVNVGLSDAEIAKIVEQSKPPTPPQAAKPAAPKKAEPAKPAAKPDAKVEPKK